MKVLFLTHTFPYPLDDGVRLHVYYLLKYLSLEHEIHLLSLNDTSVSPAHRQEIEKLDVRIAGMLVHPVPKAALARIWNCFFDPVPFFVRQFESQAFSSAIQSFLARQPVDVIHVDYLSLAIYRGLWEGRPAVAFPHDAVSMLFERSALRERSWWRRCYLMIQQKKTLSFEKKVLPQFKSVAVVSDIDRAHLDRHLPGLKMAVVTNGVDTDHFCPRPEAESPEPVILFRGVMNFFPNHDAALYFYREILPLIRARLPHARFVAAGKNPDPVWNRLAAQDPLLEVTGYVPDMREVMAKAWVVVCPMRAASGIQNKVLEPMAMAKAVIATPRATEGLRLEDGRQILFAGSQKDFASQTLLALTDLPLRRRLGAAAREHVLTYHQWRSNAAVFTRLYKEAAGF